MPFLVVAHEAHAVTHAAVSGMRLGLAGHAAYETFSVITRLPEPSRVSPALAVRILRHNFPHSEHISARRTASLFAELADAGISGGAVYDALVGAAAREHGRPLVTRDARALRTYQALGVEVVLVV